MGDDALARAIKNKKTNFTKQSTKEVPKKVSIDSLKDNPFQPRIEYDKEALDRLANSIKENGLLQAPVVSGTTIVAGHRRVRACKLAGITEIEVNDIGTVDEATLSILAIIENEHREDLDIVEAAIAYDNAVKSTLVNKREVAVKLGIDESELSKRKLIVNLHEDILKDLRINKSTKDIKSLTALRSIKDPEEQKALYFEFLKHDRNWLLENIKNENSQPQEKYDTTTLFKRHSVSLKDKKYSIDVSEFNLDEKTTLSFQKDLTKLLDMYKA
jgi:ParB/RepB/Spo0J family partition protein